MVVDSKYRLPISPQIIEFLEDVAEIDDYTNLEHILKRYEGQEIEELIVSENELKLRDYVVVCPKRPLTRTSYLKYIRRWS